MFAEEWQILASIAGFTAIEEAWLELYDNLSYRGLYLKKTAVKRFGSVVMKTLFDRKLVRYVKVPSKHPNSAAHDVGYKDLSKYAGQTVVVATKDPEMKIQEHAAKVLRYPQWIIFLMFYRAQFLAERCITDSVPVSLNYRKKHPKYSKEQTYKMVRAGLIARSEDRDPCAVCPKSNEDESACDECEYLPTSDGTCKMLPGSRTIYPSLAMQRVFWLAFVATRGYLQTDHKPWDAHPRIVGVRVYSGPQWAPSTNVSVGVEFLTPSKRLKNIYANIDHYYHDRITRVAQMVYNCAGIKEIRAYIARDRLGKTFPWIESVERKNTQAVRNAMSVSGWTSITDICKATGLRRTTVTRIFWGKGTAANPIGGLQPIKLRTKYKLRVENSTRKCVKICAGQWYYLGPHSTREGVKNNTLTSSQ